MRKLFSTLPRAAKATSLVVLLSTFAAVAQAPLDVRVALVIGNAAYRGNAALTNPGNDAKAMADTLKQLGFSVVELRDGDKAQMTASIAKVRDLLKGRQGVGMLYYAGHGLQVDWRNYMVPVDAKLETAADVPAQTIDINVVVEVFKAAGNRMNILVLDACRDNPFASKASGKGLAQVDAPPGTFLAYATAPGNVAEDGDAVGGNGLYTQFLLQELKKPSAKIEDVFKRVRLQVRKRSEGRQIPWESTSLEDDFYFNDGVKFTVQVEGQQAPTPVAVRPLSKEDKEKAAAAQFAAQKLEWERIQKSSKADDFYAFLERYPGSTELTELAQLRLNELNKPRVQAAVGQGEDASMGYTGPRFRAGDEFVYKVIDTMTNVEEAPRRNMVTSIADGVVNLNHGESLRTQLGARFKGPEGTYDSPWGGFPLELQVGKKWSSIAVRSPVGGPTNGVPYGLNAESVVTGRETITVPAGTFQTFVIQVEIFNSGGGSSRLKMWVNPRYGMPIKTEEVAKNSKGRFVRTERLELASLKAERD